MLKIIDYKLPKDVFGQEVNLKLLAHANHVYTSRNHVGLRSTKTRSEVARTTKKVYKQKGTGGARHGSRRANVFVGGGIVFGPRPLKRTLSLSQGVKTAAKIAALSAKNKAKEVLVVSGLSKVVKTAEVAEFLKKQEVKRATFLLSPKTDSAAKYLRNLKQAKTLNYTQANAYDILHGGTIVIDEEVFNVKVSKVKTAEKTLKKGETK